jgi:hypothetical protein
MANRRKVNPRTSFIICRVTSAEKAFLEKQAKDSVLDFSVYIRSLLKLKEENV